MNTIEHLTLRQYYDNQYNNNCSEQCEDGSHNTGQPNSGLCQDRKL